MSHRPSPADKAIIMCFDLILKVLVPPAMILNELIFGLTGREDELKWAIRVAVEDGIFQPRGWEKDVCGFAGHHCCIVRDQDRFNPLCCSLGIHQIQINQFGSVLFVQLHCHCVRIHPHQSRHFVLGARPRSAKTCRVVKDLSFSFGVGGKQDGVEVFCEVFDPPLFVSVIEGISEGLGVFIVIVVLGLANVKGFEGGSWADNHGGYFLFLRLYLAERCNYLIVGC